VERGDLLDALVALAEQAGVTVRVLPRGDDMRSGACRIRGAPWLLIAPNEPLEERIDAAADAVAQYAPTLLDERFVAPAVRERIEAALGCRSPQRTTEPDPH
jgi:hypothetical protein